MLSVTELSKSDLVESVKSLSSVFRASRCLHTFSFFALIAATFSCRAFSFLIFCSKFTILLTQSLFLNQLWPQPLKLFLQSGTLAGKRLFLCFQSLIICLNSLSTVYFSIQSFNFCSYLVIFFLQDFYLFL